ncbi:hypothetical protein IQ37_14255 [Chryseobacterium piperi]|uniref:Uncharacterized protein n=1 Tax=Chryseobacterium piperi TaxID=558152 RepID=A0A086B2Q5_9FLAO|nr:hypothetical protein [Chryseobacterium piperi]ASW76282.1 hypothetical protein CJF12_19720 [Chryseobacterium piperi]KFF23219.1 hypothetical protein IQ37_14255 [Chryseobacterium piperi]
MNYLKLDYKQILFFYAFLRQMDLSLDRSRWTSLKELQEYYEDRVSPEQMINYLGLKLKVSDDNSNQLSVRNENIFKDKFKLFFKKTHLTEEEATNLHNFLVLFDQYLKSDLEYYTREMEILRVGIEQFYTQLFEPKINKNDLKKIRAIEHYGQNRLAKTQELKKVIPKDFIIN